MKNKLSILSLLFIIPILIALSWVLSSFFLNDFTSVELTLGRLFFASIVLGIAYGINRSKFVWTRSWMIGQLFLAVTGRIAYLLLSTKALESISSIQALIIMDLSPFISIIIALIAEKEIKSIKPITLFFVCLSTVYATYTFISGNSLKIFPLEGSFLMFLALVFFAIHLFFYKKLTKDGPVIDSLLFQFGISAIVFIPFNLDLVQKFVALPLEKTSLFAFYSMFCNLLPFLIIHFLLKKIHPIYIQLVSTLSPLFGFVFSAFILKYKINNLFLFNSVVSIILIIVTLYFQKKSETV